MRVGLKFGESIIRNFGSEDFIHKNISGSEMSVQQRRNQTVEIFQSCHKVDVFF